MPYTQVRRRMKSTWCTTARYIPNAGIPFDRFQPKELFQTSALLPGSVCLALSFPGATPYSTREGRGARGERERPSSRFPSSSHSALHLKALCACLCRCSQVPSRSTCVHSTTHCNKGSFRNNSGNSRASPKTQLPAPSTQGTVPALLFKGCLCQHWEHKSYYLQDATTQLKGSNCSQNHRILGWKGPQGSSSPTFLGRAESNEDGPAPCPDFSRPSPGTSD